MFFYATVCVIKNFKCKTKKNYENKEKKINLIFKILSQKLKIRLWRQINKDNFCSFN